MIMEKNMISLSEHETEILKHNIDFFMKYGIKSLILFAIVFAIKFLVKKSKMSYDNKKIWIVSSIIIVVLTILFPYVISLIFLMLKIIENIKN